jgi:hypothetical protein
MHLKFAELERVRPASAAVIERLVDDLLAEETEGSDESAS